MHLQNLGNSKSAINELQNAFSNISNINRISTAEMSALTFITSNYSDEVMNLAISQMSLTKEQAIAIFTAKGLSGAELDTAVAAATLSASQTAAIGVTNGLSTAFTGLWTVLKTNPFITIASIVTVVATAFSIYQQYQENLRQATAEAADTYNDALKSIDDYNARYKELHDALLAAKGNEEETYNVKKQLLDLQTELNDKFGEEYGYLNLVTDAYRDQTDAIKAYNKEAAQKFLNENEKGIKLAEEKMTDENHYNLSYTGMSGYTESGKALIEIAKKYEDKGISLLDEAGTGDYSQFSIHLNADAKTAYDTIHSFESDVRERAKTLGDKHIFDDVLEISSASVNNAKEIIDGYGEEYKAGLIANITTDDKLAPQFEQALKAVEEYNEAVLKSQSPTNDEKVDHAYQNLQKVKKEIQENAEEWGRYSEITNNVFSQADTGLYEFRNAIKDNKGGIADLINQFQGKTDTDLLSLYNTESDESFNKLTTYADEYSLSIKQVIDELLKMKVITGKITQDTGTDINPFSKNEMITAINEMSTGFESLEKLKSSITDENPFDYSLLDDDHFNKIFSGLEDEYSKFIDTISTSPKDMDSCQSAFDNLLTAWFDSTGILKGLSYETAQLTTNMLNNMGVANAEEVVAGALAQKYALLAAEKEYSSLTSQQLSDATIQDIINFYNSSDATDIAKQSIIQYYLEKQFAAGISLDTSEDVAQLINLVSALGGVTSALDIYYKSLNGSLNYADISGMGGSDAKYMKQMAQVQARAELEKIKARMSKNVVPPRLGNSMKNTGSKGGSSGASDKGTEKEFNWIDRKMQHLEDKRQELIDKASSASIPYLGLDNQSASQLQDYFTKTESGIALTSDEFANLSLIADKVGISVANLFNELKNGGSESRKGYMAQALEVDKKIIEECTSDVEYYNALYEEAASKLSDELRIKVETGGDGIETLTGEEAKHVEKAMEAFDKRSQALQKEADARQQYSDDSKTYAEIELEYLDKQADAIEHRNNMIQKQIDFLIASGNVVNVSAYESLIANLQQDEAILNKKLALKKNELRQKLSSGEINKDDEAYFEMLSYINSCEESLADLAIRQEEYHDKIRQLPIENMQKILNMYEDISNALQDYADMVEASGRKLDAEYYQTQIKNGIKTIAQYKEQADLIRDVMDEYDVGSDKYLEMYDKLQDVNASISSIVKNMHEWNKELLALPISSINDQLTGLSEALDGFQAIQSDHESVINAVTDAINEQIDALEEQRETETEAAQSEIDALQEKLDLLQKQNEERKIQLALEQAKYDLERAQNQKSNKVVRDGELVWEADPDEIRSASQSVADAQYDKLTYDLEKQKEALEENLTLIEERYQKQIDQLTEMSEKWSKIKSDTEAAADAALADQYLGEGWKDQAASGNDKDIYEAFRNSYNTNNQMVSKYEKQIQSTEKIYNLLNSYIAAYQAGTLSYEQAMASIKALLSQMNHDMSAGQSLQNVLDYLGKVNGTDADADSVLSGIQAQLKADSDEMLKNLEQYNDNLALITDCMTSWEQLTTDIGDIRSLMDDVIEALEDGFDSLAGALENDLRNKKDEEEDDNEDDSSQSSGTVSAGGSSNSHYTGSDVNHNSDQDPDHGPGVARYASGIEKGMIRASGMIPTPASVERLKKLSTESFRNNGQVPIIAHEGEVVLNPEQQKKLLDNFDALRHQNLKIPVSPMFSPTPPPTAATYNFGDIQMYGVQDVDGFAQSLKYNAGPIIHQVFSRR